MRLLTRRFTQSDPTHPKLRSVVSYPCFEYWVLLHFNYTRASLPSVGKRSCGKRMLDLLLTEWPGYKKGAKNVYLELARQDLTDIAIDRAARARADADATGDPDPSTEIDRLVLRLRQLSTEFLAISR
ncbi:MAG: RloB domain-containing protein [Rhodoferax sp.]|nr:RloB domain-containing protein [Rhodoferax sp.]